MPLWPLSHAGTMVYMLGARRLARTTCRSCTTCHQIAARTEHQQMGQLPFNRVSPSSPFTVTGIDYAGPFTMKKGHTRKPTLIKVYLAIFSTKAAHLEVVSDMTTETFLACLHRLRGLPTEIHTDNGSNFKGAKNDLSELFHFLQATSTQEAVNSYLLFQRVQWHCIPERAPHFGSAAFKSAKYHLKRVIGTQRLFFLLRGTSLLVNQSVPTRKLPSIHLHPPSDAGCCVNRSFNIILETLVRGVPPVTPTLTEMEDSPDQSLTRQPSSRT